MEIKIIGDDFCICKIDDIKKVDFKDEFVFVSKTDEEISLVCKKEYAPKDTIKISFGYTAIRIEGELDFSLIGILANISSILAKEKISIFAISTYNTDYVLVSTEKKELAINALKNNGYIIK